MSFYVGSIISMQVPKRDWWSKVKRFFGFKIEYETALFKITATTNCTISHQPHDLRK